VLVLLSAACQPMPHPFQAEDKTANPLLAIKDRVGVTVAPVAGLPPTFGRRLGEAVAGALRDAEIAAAFDVRNRGSLLVMGSASWAARGAPAGSPSGSQAAAPEPEIDLAWVVFAPSGETLGSFTARERVPGATLDDDSSGPPPGPLAAIAQRSVAKLAPLVRDEATAEVAQPAILVGAIDGAPGDGAVSLKRALEFVLRQSDVPVATPDNPKALTLVGSIEMGRPADGRQKVAIRWILKLPDGSDLGAVRQENAVAAGSLDHAWGSIALLVAEAAYDGIVALYEKAPGVLAQ
jgi:hypothetical protein